MAHIVTVTIAGGEYLGPENDTPTQINADKIVKINKPSEDEIGNAVITMDNKERLHTTETPEQLKVIINKTK